MDHKKIKKRPNLRGEATNGISIKETVKRDGKYSWSTYTVQGWKEHGKWRRRQFKRRQDAEVFAADKRIALANEGRPQTLMLCPLPQERLDDAVRATERLGTMYSLDEAVTFFLKHHRTPDFTIHVSDAVDHYLEERERDGLRSTTLTGLKSTLTNFSRRTDDPKVHEVTPRTIEDFLHTLRTKDGTSQASRKTWNNNRNDLNKFFSWCREADKTTERPWIFQDPVGPVRKFNARQVREQQPSTPATTSPEKVERMLSVLMRWRGGVMLRHFCYLYFTGIRPYELKRLSSREAELVNLKTAVVTLPAEVAKGRFPRQVGIPPNMLRWLQVAPGPIKPKNFDRLYRRVRNHFKLGQDEARHSFISFHVALHRSLGDASLQAGNSESVIRQHYLNVHPKEEGRAFFSLTPCLKTRRAVSSQNLLQDADPILKAI